MRKTVITLAICASLLACVCAAQEVSIVLRDSGRLTDTERKELLTELKEWNFKSANSGELSERLKYGCQIAGFLKSQVTLVGTQATIVPGTRYRVRNINISGAKHISTEEIRQQFALKPGGIFNFNLVHQGLEKVNRLYGEAGFLNVTIVPDLTYDDAAAVADLSIEIDEAEQFRWGTLTIRGSDSVPGAKSKLESAWSSHLGQPYTAASFNQFCQAVGLRDDAKNAFRFDTDRTNHEVNVSITLTDLGLK